jgi:transketolase
MMKFYRCAWLAFVVVLEVVCIGPAALAQEAVEKSSAEITTEPEETPAADVEKKTEEEPAKEKSAPREKSSEMLQDLMTAEEFKAAGLDKLAEEELKNLNAWLQGYRHTTASKAAEEATAEVTKKVAKESRAKMDKIVSRVDGEFKGLTGNTVIKLEDGTIWKQANSGDRFHAQVTDHPPAAVMHGVFGYKMRVVGTGEFYVDPVRK